MSTIDERIVEMRFENKQFEQGAQQSMQTIEKLKNSLNFEGVSDSMAKIEKSMNGMSFSGIQNGVAEVGRSFTGLEVMAITALSNITNKGVNALEHALKTVTIDQFGAGFSKYESKTQSIQTIMAATGKSIEEVTEYVDRLTWFTDETSYSLLDMVNNIGKFTSNGIALDDATNSMQGIATAAALAGANVTQASHAMEGFSKAMGTGYMTRQNWTWIKSAKMDTKEFKQQLIDAALAVGTLEEVEEGLYVTTKGNEVSFSNFEQELKDGWLTTEALTGALREYGDYAEKVYQYQTDNEDRIHSATEAIKEMRAMEGGVQSLGERAFRAAQETKTLSEAINYVKEAVSSGWMTTFELIFGNYEQAKSMWSELAEYLYDVFVAAGDQRNEVLASALSTEDWLDAPLEKSNWLEKMGETTDELKVFQRLLQETAAESNEVAKNWLDKGAGFFFFLEQGFITADVFQEALAKIDHLAEGVEGVTSNFEELAEVAEQVMHGQWGNGVDRMNRLTEAGYDYAKVQAIVNHELLGTELALEDFNEETLRAANYTEEEIALLMQLKKTAQSTGQPLYELIRTMRKPTGRELLIESLMKVLYDLLDIINAVKAGLQEVFPPITAERIRELLESFHDLVFGIELTEEKLDRIRKATVVFFRPLGLLVNVISFLVKTLVPPLIRGVLFFIKALVNVSAFVYDIAHDILHLNDIFGAFKNIIESIPKSLKELFGDERYARLAAAFGTIVTRLSTAFDAIKKKVDELWNALKNNKVLQGWISKFETFRKTLKDSVLDSIVSFVEKIANFKLEFNLNGFKNLKPITRAFNLLKTALESVRNVLLGLIGAAGAGLMLAFQKALGAIGEKIKAVFGEERYARLAAAFQKIGTRIIGVFDKVRTKVQALWDTIKKNEFVSKILEKFGKIGDLGQTLKENLLDGIVNFVEKVADFKFDFKLDFLEKHPKILESFNKLKGVFESIKSIIGELVGTVGGGVLYLFKDILEKCGANTEGLQTAIDKLPKSRLIDFFKESTENAETLGDRIKAIYEHIKERLMPILDALVEKVVAIKDKIVEIFSNIDWDKVKVFVEGLGEKIAKELENTSFGQMISTVVVLDYASILRNVSRSFGGFAGLEKSLSQLAKSIDKYINAKAMGEKASALLTFAFALGVLVAALWALIAIPVDKFNEHLEMIKLFARIIADFFAVIQVVNVIKSALTAFSKNGPTAEKDISPLATIIESVRDVLFSIKGLVKGFANLGNVLAVIGIILALLLLRKTLLKFADTPMDQIQAGLKNMMPVLLTLIGIMGVVSVLGKGAGSFGFNMLALIGAMFLLYKFIIYLSNQDINYNQLAKGLFGAILVIGLMSILARATRAAAKNTSAKSMLGFAGSMFGVSIAIYILAQAMLSLAEMETGKLITTAIVIGVFMTIMGKMAAMSKDAESFKGSSFIGMAFAIGAMAASMYMLAQLPTLKLITTALVLIACMYALKQAMSIATSTDWKSAFVSCGVMIAVLVAISMAIHMLTFVETDKLLAIGAALGGGLLGLAAAMYVLQGMQPQAAASAALSVLAFLGTIVGIMSVVSAIVGLLPEDVKTTILNGLHTLAEIVSGIFEIFGAAFNGLVVGATKDLDKVGEQIGKFVSAVVPMSQDAGKIETKNFDAILKTLDLYGMIASGSLWTDLKNAITGNTPTKRVEEINQCLSTLVNGLVTLCVGDGESKGISGLSFIQLTKATKAMEIFGQLVEAAKNIPNTGGFWGDLVGNNDMKDFVGQFEKVAEELVKFGEKTKELDNGVSKKAELVASVIVTMSDAAQKVPNAGGLLADWLGDNKLKDFAADLTGFAEGLNTFLETGKEIGEPQKAKVQTFADIITMFAEAAQKVPNAGGKIATWLGDNDLSSFGSQLVAISMSLARLFLAVDTWKFTERTADITAFTTIISDLANMAVSLQPIDASGTLLSDFGHQLESFGNSLNDFFTTTATVQATALDTVLDLLQKLADFVSTSNLVDSIGGLTESIISSYTMGLTEEQSKVAIETAGMALVTFTGGAMQAQPEAMNTAADFLVQTFVTKFADEGNKQKATDAGSALSTAASKGIRDNRSQFESAAQYCVDGFISKLQQNAEKVRTESANSIGGAAIAGTANAIDSNSPSKEFGKLGDYSVLGFINRIKAGTSSVKDTTESMGETAISSLKATIAALASAMFDDDDTFTITPVLDLSNVQAGAGAISSMLNGNRAVSLAMTDNAEIAGRMYAAQQNLAQENSKWSQFADRIVQGVSDSVGNMEVRVDNNVTLEGEARGLFKAVRKENGQYRKSTGHSAFK